MRAWSAWPSTWRTPLRRRSPAEPVTLERIRQIEPALNDHLRLTRQIDRFAQFEMRVEEKREIAKNARGKVEMFALQAYAKEAGMKGGPRVPR